MNKVELKNKANSLPLKSGVYIMRDNADNIIYIGKAKRLRNRVKQYFDETKKQIKVQSMVNNIFGFDYILTKSDADAYLLENNLIKQHKPKYNILLKDDKQYPYIKITTREKFPRILVTRKIDNDNALYFGPYVSFSVNSMVDILRCAFRIRTCAINFEKKKTNKQPCLHGQINKCMAPCSGKVDEKEYMQAVQNVIDFLKGDITIALKILEQQMLECAEKEDFENAIEIRNKIDMIHKMTQTNIASLTKNESFDVFAIRKSEDFCVVNVCWIRYGKNIGQTNYLVNDICEDLQECLESFIVNYYSHSSLMQKNILVNLELTDLANCLKEKWQTVVTIVKPKKGIKAQIVKICEDNADEYIDKIQNKNEYRQNLTVVALDELQNVLGVEKINRIEGFDISNIQGTNNVSSMVVFVGGEPAYKEYRKFKIKTFEGADDFASMAETISRRFERYKSGDVKFTELPDLILIDGGLGQLHSANAVLEEMNIDIPIISLAKKNEEIYTVFSNEPIVLEKRSFALRLLQRVRDESHRFAITFHRTIRNRGFLSEFEKITGIGKKTREKIFHSYKSVDDLYNANIFELKETLGVGEKMASAIFNSLHKTAK